MLGQPVLAMHQLNKFYSEHVLTRKAAIARNIGDVCKTVTDILKEVESQEPRFISTLHDNNGHYEGFHVLSPNHFEIILYLNQMGVFNFVDDGTVPGCAVLKLSDGRKRSMSLWVEFITASGYLSSRKIRSRFQTLVAQAVDRSAYRDVVKMIPDTSEVRLRIRDRYVVQITCAFRCSGIWPRSASVWPLPNAPWPAKPLVDEVKSEGFDLFSKDSLPVLTKQQASMEGDAWMMSFVQAEDILLSHGCRRKALAILKTLKDIYLEPVPDNPINAYILKTLVMFECEKHPAETAWDEMSLGDRIIGVTLQLVSCLQCRKCPHYFIPTLDLLIGKSPESLDMAAKAAWRLVRDLITNPRCLEAIRY